VPRRVQSILQERLLLGLGDGVQSQCQRDGEDGNGSSEKSALKFPFAFLQKGSAMTHRATNPLAYEVSRAFIPPCTRRDVFLASGSSRTSHFLSNAGTLAANSTCIDANSMPDGKVISFHRLTRPHAEGCTKSAYNVTNEWAFGTSTEHEQP
jgi:hypothetical protein